LANSFHSSRLYGFLCELRRRKVYRVAAGYAVAGWLIIQVAVVVFPVLALPGWVTRFVVFFVLGGFPIALVLGWAFDVGPGGIQVTPEPAANTECPPSYPGRRKNLYVLALAGLTISAAIGYFLFARNSAHSLDKSIAVLPFSNFSDDSQNAYFADGIQDDILTSLAKIGELKVISRTSVMPYRGQAHNAREIGKALDVATILEGSVRREGKRVRINVQLIDATNDKHLWAQIYDRELTDVFAIQTDLAQEIASALKATLSAGEQERIERKPTRNSEAYLLYLQAHEIFTRPDRRHDDLARAETLYEKAIQLDPMFALAQARLSQLESWSYYAVEPVAARMQKARAAASEALRLEPHLAEAHLALGLIYYYIERDYDRALGELDIARHDLPNDAILFRLAAAIKRRQGKWEESSANYEKALSVDPKDPILLENMGWNYIATRDYAKARKVFDRAVEAAPDTFTIRELRARVEFYDEGDLRPMQQLLASWPENVDPNGTITLTRYNYHLYQRNYAELVGILERSPAQKSRGETSAPISKSYLMATVYALMKDEAKASAKFEEARLQAEAAVRESPEDGPRHALLGLIYAGLGRCAEAIAEGKRAVESLPDTKDAFDGPILAITRARISVMCGDHTTALALIERSLRIPAGITVNELQRDPTWDPLRNDPRFKQLIAHDGGAR
jgi:TolB-like protein/regulator of sirC expression with transglutaminase-like and TPR domain